MTHPKFRPFQRSHVKPIPVPTQQWFNTERKTVVVSTLATALTMALKVPLVYDNNAHVAAADMALLPLALTIPRWRAILADEDGDANYTDALLFAGFAALTNFFAAAAEDNFASRGFQAAALTSGAALASYAAAKMYARLYLDTHHAVWRKFY